jgi:guanosine-3',5'-bis(diphosphate) 3'-pyrophosphohydrolase
MTPTDVIAAGREPDEIFASLVVAYRGFHPDDDASLLEAAYRMGSKAHAGQTRQTGDAYITHPLIVAEILANFEQDSETLVAAILHDVIEDTPVALDHVSAEFGYEVAGLIDGVTKLDRVKFSSKKAQQAATIRKMAIAIAKDERVLLIKLVDRLHNIRTLDPLPEEKQRRVAVETLEIYAPLAHRFGVQEIKHEMEDRCFALLYPKRNAELNELVRRRSPERDAILEKVQNEARSALADAGIDTDVIGRPKHLYSIYRKMVASGLAFEEIHDLIGLRILVAEIRDCYAALGLVHISWPPIQGRFKDYIATPKLNGYQSLHTTVVGPDGKPLEVQIRTRQMHKFAERGIAAHWAYKQGELLPSDRSLMDELLLDEVSDDPEEFLSDLKAALVHLQDEVYALSPRGDVITLPAGATPVDFAYRIHTDVGHRCVGAKIDGRLVPLDTIIESGDIIEIVISKAQDAHPSLDWLKFVQSGRAAAKIRRWFSKERREVALQDGRERLVKALRREGLKSRTGREKVLIEVAEDLGYSNLDALYIAIGDGRISAGSVARRLDRLANPQVPEEEALDVSTPLARHRPSRGVIVEGMDDMLSRIARCCSPVPGDDIIGFVTVGRGVSVHRPDCTNIGSLGERNERIIDVEWGPDQEGTFFVWLQIEALDRPRLLRDVTTALSDLGANIHASSSTTGRDRIAKLRYEVELSDGRLLDRSLAALHEVDGVFDAYRLGPQNGR